MGTGTPRDSDFNVIVGTHIFYAVKLTSAEDFCEVQAFAVKFDEQLKLLSVGFDEHKGASKYFIYFLVSDTQAFGKIGGATNKFIFRRYNAAPSDNLCTLTPS